MGVSTGGLGGPDECLGLRAHSSDQHSHELHGGEVAYHSEKQVAL